jgi:hypothetical protein
MVPRCRRSACDTPADASVGHPSGNSDTPLR